jgi:hypothetical protein
MRLLVVHPIGYGPWRPYCLVASRLGPRGPMVRQAGRDPWSLHARVVVLTVGEVKGLERLVPLTPVSTPTGDRDLAGQGRLGTA